MKKLIRSKSSVDSSTISPSTYSVTPISLNTPDTRSSSSSSTTSNSFDFTPKRKYYSSPYPVDYLPTTGDSKVDQFFKNKSPYDESLQLVGDFEIFNLPSILQVLKKYRNLTTLTMHLTKLKYSVLLQEIGIAGIYGNISTLNLSHNFIHDDDFILIINQLKRLPDSPNYTLNFSYNVITDKGIEYYSNALVSWNKNHLKTLNLSFNKISSKGIKLLCNSLKKNINNFPEFQYLFIGGNMLGNSGIKQLCKSIISKSELDDMKYLDLSSNNLTENRMKKISKYFQNINTISGLDLSDNRIGDKGMKYLINSFSKSISHGISYFCLKYLDLSNISLTSEGVFTLCENKQLNELFENIEEFYINNNNIENKGIIILMKAIKNCEKNSCLKIVDFSNNNIGDIGIMELTKTIHERKLMSLEMIYFDRNLVGRTGFDSFKSVIEENDVPKLKLLTVRENKIPQENIDAMKKFLKIKKMKTKVIF